MTFQETYSEINFHITNVKEPSSQNTLLTIAERDPLCFESVLKALLHSRNFATEDKTVLASIEQVLIQLSEVRGRLAQRTATRVKYLSILVAAFVNSRLEKGDFDTVPRSILDRRSESIANVLRALLLEPKNADPFLDVLVRTMCYPDLDPNRIFSVAYSIFLDSGSSLRAMWNLFFIMEHRSTEPSKFNSFFEDLAKCDSFLFARNLSNIYYSTSASKYIRAAIVDILSELAKQAELTQPILRSLARCSEKQKLLNEVLYRSGSILSASFRPKRGRPSVLGSGKPVPPQHDHARDRRLVRQGLSRV